MNARFLKKAAVALALGFCIGSAQADLARVGPANTPSPPGNGYPLWYQDLSGLALDLCLPDATDPGALQQNACLLDFINPPYVFPSNFPDESFYFMATSEPLPLGAGGAKALVVLAVEAAFANGGPVAGDQMVFTRIRVVAGVPENGTYTVTHPYGVEVFPDVQATGARDIFLTDDVGITPGNFTGALTSRVGPFLQALDPVTGGVKRLTLNGATFLSDGVTPELVTGSPFGTNYVEVCGVRADGTPIPLGTAGASGSCARTELFTVLGRVHDNAANPIGSPLAITKATYYRDASGSLVDVSANASAGVGQAAPKLTAATVDLPPVLMTGPDMLGNFYAQAVPNPLGAIPSTVTVTNSGDVPPTSVARSIVDEVKVTQASYDRATQLLTVVASTSDKGTATIPAPALTVEGFPGACTASAPGAVFCEAITAVAPPTITVTSAAGGQARVVVTIDVSAGVSSAFASANSAAGVPFTQDDAAAAIANGLPVAIPVLANDSSNAGAPLDPASVTVLAPGLTPAIGTLAVDAATGNVIFTPSAAIGTATFTYTVSNAEGPSNVSTVTIEVAAPAGGPIPIAANDGPFPLAVNSSLVVDVLANDNGNGGTLDPASVAIATPPSVGSATVNPDGTITYVSGAAGGTVTFTYTVKDTVSATNPAPVASQPATVTLNVVAPEQVGIARSECVTGKARWRVEGTSSVAAPNTITVYTTATVPAAPTSSQIVGTAQVDVTGLWALDVSGVSCVSPISVQSSLGTTRENIAVQFR